MPEKKIYSLSNLTQSLQNVINAHCNKVVWIKAEIVKLNYYPKSGHCYPTLVEKKNGKVIAEMRGNIWGAHFAIINNKFKTVLKEELKDDITVVIKGSINYHPLHGLALNITDIDPEYTLGELAREKAETIDRLKAENIFTANKQTVLPVLPKTIAIISVETSKGYGDFINVIEKNPKAYKFHFLLFPAILQGERAVPTILQQLEKIEKNSDNFDAVAIIRGGGGEIGLSCFDSYVLAEKIAVYPIPVLTGIGHSNNETVSEMVSYGSFITPTKVAEFLLQKFNDFAVQLQEAEQILMTETEWMFKSEKTNLKETARLFSSLTSNAMDNSKAEVNSLIFQLQNFGQQLLREHKIQLQQNKKMLISHAKQPIMGAVKELNFLDEKVRMLSPINVLKRGFSITRHNGKIIRNPEAFAKGDLLETELYSGSLTSRIENIKKSKKNE